MPLRQRLTIALLALVIANTLNGCGTNKPPVVQSPPLATSAIGCPGGTLPCSASMEVPLILVNGADPATYGIPISCSVTAGSQAMKFSTVPSTPWFTVSPVSGSLQPGGSSTIGVPNLNAANVNARNIGVVTVNASGYATNNQMAVELNCNLAAGSCVVAYSCEPSTHPLP